MTIENLHCFLILAEALSFTKAAKKAHITQAAMSRKITSIEAELDVQLFNRNRHTVSLTPIGQELYDLVHPILEDYDHAVSRVQNLSKGIFDVVQVGIGIYEHQLLFPVMQHFLKKNPISQIHFLQFKYRELVEEFNRGHIDLIISSDQYFDMLTGDNLEKHLIHNRPWVLAVNKNNPLAKQSPIPLSSLDSQNIITMNRNSLSVLDSVYKGRFHPSSADYVNSHETKLLLINANRGVGFIPEFVDVSTYPEVVTCELVPYYRPRRFYAVLKKDNPNLCAHHLAQMLSSHYLPTLWLEDPFSSLRR